MSNILKSLELDFTRMDFYESYVISEVHEGEVLTKEYIDRLTEACLDFYEDRKYVYISKRKELYNVDPTIYMNLEKIENLRGIAICSEMLSTLNMAQFEKTFSKVPFEIFINLGEAKIWAKSRIKK